MKLKTDNVRGFALSFTPDGRSLVTVGTTTTVWDPVSHKKRRDLTVGGTVDKVMAIASDSRTLAISGSVTELQVWDLETGEGRGSYTGSKNIMSIAAVPNSALVAVSDAYSGPVLWDTALERVVGTPGAQLGGGFPIAASPDGTRLAVVGSRGVSLWDIPHGVSLGTMAIEEPLGLYDLDFAPDGTLAVESSKVLRLFPAGTYPGSSPHEVRALTFDTSGSHVLALTSAGVLDKMDSQLHSVNRTEVGHSAWTVGIFSPDRTLLAHGSRTEPLSVRNLTSGTETTMIGAGSEAGSTWRLAFSPDSRTLLAAQHGESYALWRLNGDRPPSPIGPKRRTDYGPVLTAASFASDDDIALGDYMDGLKVRNLTTQRQTVLTDSGMGYVAAISLSPDRRWLSAATSDHVVTVWDTTTWHKMAELRGHTATVSALVFSPDGLRLATGSGDHTITVWDIPSGTRWATLSGHAGKVDHFAWRPDGRALVSSSSDDALRLWSLDMDHVVGSLRARSGSR